jgi:hypothetical protein
VRVGSEAGAPESPEFQRLLEVELRRLGFGFSPDASAGAAIEVTLSDSYQGTLAIAEIRSGDAIRVAMVLRPREPRAPSSGGAPLLTLQLQPLVERVEPILDVLPIEDSLLVLGPESLVLRRAAAGDSVRQAVPVTHSRPWPRDPRGRVLSDGAAVQVYLPGIRCQGTLRPLALSCGDSRDAWPLDGAEAVLVPDRNYFEADGFRPFYSMARLGPSEAPRRLIAGIDGKSCLYDSRGEIIAVADGIGSDLAAVKSGCGSGVQILAAIQGGLDHPDLLQAFEWADLRAAAIGTPAEVAGTITALWPGADGTAAVLITHNIEAGRYEAYRVSVACSR